MTAKDAAAVKAETHGDAPGKTMEKGGQKKMFSEGRWWYWRARRLWRSLFPRFGPADEKLVLLLEPMERSLFLRLSPADRRHSLDVAQALRDRGDFMVRVALLHDLGKIGVAPGTLGRVLVALGFRPQFLAGYLEHARRGEALGRDLGLPEEILFFIGHHHETAGDELLRALQEADERW